MERGQVHRHTDRKAGSGGTSHSEAVASTTQQPGSLACLLCVVWGWGRESAEDVYGPAVSNIWKLQFLHTILYKHSDFYTLSTFALGQKEGFGIPLNFTLGEGFAILGVWNIEVLDLGHTQVNNFIPSRLHLYLAHLQGLPQLPDNPNSRKQVCSAGRRPEERKGWYHECVA